MPGCPRLCAQAAAFHFAVSGGEAVRARCLHASSPMAEVPRAQGACAHYTIRGPRAPSRKSNWPSGSYMKPK
eukprot:1627987-Prymnesium_polylepis.3